MRTLRNTLKTLILALPVFLVSVSFAAAQGVAEMLSNGIQQVLWDVVVNFFGFLAATAGELLDYAIQQFVVQFGINFLGSGVGQAVDTLWVYVRDLFNLFFIFGLVWLGLQMILNSDDSNTRRWLVNLIMAALLVNFSLYITKFIVDFTNVLATQIINNGFGVSTPSDVIVNALSLSSLFGSNLPNTVTTGGGGWAYIFGTAMILIVSTFVFAAGAVMLILRYAVLAIYMVLSPLMFIGWVFPQLSNVASKYWRGFLARAFYAPVYILLLYFAAFIMERYFGGSMTATGAQNFASFFSASGAGFTATLQATMPPFILACIFMIAAIVVGQKMGADGAAASVRMGQNLTGRLRRGATRAAGAATVGGAAWAARNTAGRYGNSKINDEDFKRRAATSYVGKLKYRAAAAAAGASFDARQIGGVGKDLGLGTGRTGGYAKSVKDRQKADENFAKEIAANVNLNDPKVRAEIAEKAKAEKTKLIEQATTAQFQAEKAESYRALNQTELEAKREEIISQDGKSGKLKAAQDELANPATTAERKAELEAEIKDFVESLSLLNAQIGKTDTERNIEVSARKIAASDLYDKTSDEGRLEKEANNIATAKTKYANEIAYIEQLRTSRNRWQGGLTTALTGAGGTTAGSYGMATATGGATFLSGAAGGLYLAGQARQAEIDRLNRSISNLERIYGADGTIAAAKDKQVKQAKTFAEAIRDTAGDEATGGGDGGDSKAS